MRRLAIALTASIAGSSAVLLMPLNFYVPQRHALAQRAVASGWPSFAAALLTPLAQLSDPRALNNLGVLRARGVGTPQNFDDASRLFARAADRGSTRARLNAAMIAPGSCGLNVSQAAATGRSTRADCGIRCCRGQPYPGLPVFPGHQHDAAGPRSALADGRRANPANQ